MIHSPGKRGTSVDQSDKVFDTESMESGVELTPKTGPQGRGGGVRCPVPPPLPTGCGGSLLVDQQSQLA